MTAAPVAGGGVLGMERDACTIYDIACIRESAKSATREDVEFKAIADAMLAARTQP